MKQTVKFSKSDLNSFIKQVKSLNMKDVKKSIYEDNILAIVKHNNLSLVMNNTETEIIADFSCESESEFEFLLSLKDIKKVLKIFEDDLEVVLENSSASINGKYTWVLLNPEFFQRVNVGESQSKSIQLKDTEIFNKVIYSMAKDDYRKALCGCLIKSSKDNRECELITTNGHCLSYAKDSWDGFSYFEDLEILVPRSFVNFFVNNTIDRVVEYGNDITSIQIQLFASGVKSLLRVKNGKYSTLNFTVVSKFIDQRFPMYQKITEQLKYTSNVTLEINTNVYSNAIEYFDAVNTFNKKEFPWVKFVISNTDSLELSDANLNKETINIKNITDCRIDKDRDLGYSLNYLLDVAKLSKDLKLEKLVFQTEQGYKSVARFKLGDNLEYYLMPNRCSSAK
ncbi:MAG: hypothetical protein ACTTIS_01125 [Streptobacillus sp.]